MRVRLTFVLGLFITASLGLACNSTEQTAPRSTARSTSSPVMTGEVPTVNADGIRRITTVELRDLIEKNQAFVVDVRNEASFAVSHITGAKLVPVQDVLKHAGELPKDKLIVTYCS